MPQPDRPESYPHRVLLAVTGLSPQVVTETLYALATQAKPAFVPTEIQLVTTRQGAEHARLNLLSQQIGWFHRLRTDYGLPEIAFDAARIHVIPDDAGRELDDIRSVADNARTADFITERVRALTSDPQCALHVSIAGGRKTMGYYLGYALSLDRPNTLYHDKARQLVRAALEGGDWTQEEKNAVAQAIEELLPKVVAVEWKEEQKKLKIAQLRGNA